MAKPLSREQLHYALSRVEDLRRSEELQINEDCKLPAPKATTFGELVRGIKNGKIKLKSTRGVDDHIIDSTAISTSFDGLTPYQSYRKYDEKKRKVLLETHHKKWLEVRDKLYLSDAPEALKLIESLSKKS